MDQPLFDCWAGPLADALSTAASFAGNKNAWMKFQNIAFDQLGNTLRVVGSDGYRFVVIEASSAEMGPMMGNGAYMMPKDDAVRLGRELAKVDGRLNVYVSDQRFRFRLEDAAPDDPEWYGFHTRGTAYFPWKELVHGLREQEVAGTVMYDLPEMLAVVGEAKRMKAPALRFMVSDAGVHVAAHRGWEREVASGFWIEDTAPLASFQANPDFLLSAVKATDGAPLRVYADPKRPLQLVDSSRMALVMPIRASTDESSQRRAAGQ